MFRFKKKKQQIEIKAPVFGKSVSIESVPDDTFATKLMGEGVAFKFSGSDICAPVTGELILVADTLHAFGIRDTHGVEILVHIGLETVTLNGAGFIKIKEIGQKVFEGEPIIKVDQTYMLKSGLNMITMMVVTNSSDYQISLDNLESNVDLDSVMIRCIAN